VDLADFVPWVLGGIALLLFVALTLWMAKVERESAGKQQKPGIKVNSFFSGPVGTGIYKPIDDRRKAEKAEGEESPSPEGDRSGPS
jgi:hypothetical protein